LGLGAKRKGKNSYTNISRSH